MLHFKLARLREDVPALLKLAGPLLIGQLAVIAFGVLDTAMTAVSYTHLTLPTKCSV